MNISKKLLRFLLISNLLSWIAIIFLLMNFTEDKSLQSVDELIAKRINIVNEDGTTVLAISNKQRIAPPVMNGKEYPVKMIERQHYAGMIFFNEEGDEMGGLIFNSFKLPNGKIAGSGHLSFDRYNDNQVLSLEYKENKHGKVQTGLTFYDRPGDGSFGKHLELMREYYYDSISKSRRKELLQEMRALKKDKGLGAERVFIGSTNEIPQFIIRDKKGTPRIKITMDKEGNGVLLFLNDRGEVISKYPEA